MDNITDAGCEDWVPPSDAELKVIQARRDRTDKISKLMGDYLLKGYKMLASCCHVCGTILLQDRQKNLYCVACVDLETEAPKDNPALSEEAANRKIAESHFLQTETSVSNAPADEHLASSSADHHTGEPRPSVAGETELDEGHQERTPVPSCGTKKKSTHCREQGNREPNSSLSVCQMALDAVQKKMEWATLQLSNTSSIDTGIQLASLIKSCADALGSLHQAMKNV